MGVVVRQKVKGKGQPWWIFINHDGQRTSKKVGSEKAAEIVAARLQAEIALSDFNIEPKKKPEPKKQIPTFQKYVYGHAGDPGWLDKRTMKHSTRLSYESILSGHLAPKFGKRHLDQITPSIVDEFIRDQFEKGLNSRTIKNHINCLSGILRIAQKTDRFIGENPVNSVEIKTPEVETTTRESHPFSWEERERFEAVVKKHFPQFYEMTVLLFRTGLRIGEVLGLQWDDIDWNKGVLKVQRSFTQNKLTTPKTKSGFRKVRMTGKLQELLKQKLLKAKMQTLANGWREVPEWIFYNSSRSHYAYSSIHRDFWSKAVKKAGLEGRRLHDARHTYATLRLLAGHPLAEVAKEMGHSSSNITYQTYFNFIPDASTTDIDELDVRVIQA